MSRDCPCVQILTSIICGVDVAPRYVYIIGEYLHRGDVDIINHLTRKNRTPYLHHGNPWDESLMTSAESHSGTILWYRDDNVNIQPHQRCDRWVFEVGIRGPMTPVWTKTQFVRFLGTSSGMPQKGNAMSRCIITVINGRIVVDIDAVLIGINPAGDFGKHLGTPFMKSRRAQLRSQMYNLYDKEEEDIAHKLFDRLCDLVHSAIWAYLH